MRTEKQITILDKIEKLSKLSNVTISIILSQSRDSRESTGVILNGEHVKVSLLSGDSEDAYLSTLIRAEELVIKSNEIIQHNLNHPDLLQAIQYRLRQNNQYY